MNDIFGKTEEWPGTEAWLKDPEEGPKHYESFQEAGFTPHEAGKLACLAVDQGYFSVVRDLQKLEKANVKAIDRAPIPDDWSSFSVGQLPGPLSS